jgi:hypothetical protein
MFGVDGDVAMWLTGFCALLPLPGADYPGTVLLHSLELV